MHLQVAIDFTGSNGNPSNPTSLHYMGNPGQLNQYQNAICSVGEILMPYSLDKEVVVRRKLKEMN